MFLVSLPMWGQAARKLTPKELPPSAFKLIAIKVTGTQRYRPEEIIGLSSLQLGQTVNEDDFKRTSRLLAETGAFSNVVYSFQYSPDGTKLELQLTDAEQFVPARFDNFVWFSDQELMQKVRERVPLFDGQLPATGNLADMISDALQAMLIQAGVPGRADYLRSAKAEGPIDAVVFSVTGADVNVRNVDFRGASAEEVPRLAVVAKPMRGEEYHRAMLRTQADKDLLPVMLAKGYLKAQISDPEAKVVGRDEQQTVVDITFSIDPGPQYKVGRVDWAGNSLFPTDKLQPLIHLAPGQAADAVQLGADLREVQGLYGTKGYMAAAVKPVPTFDDTQETVNYLLQVEEGEQFHMGDLEITGLDTRTIDRLVDRWQLQGGAPYDSGYLRRFLGELTNDVLALSQWKVSTHVSLNQKDKTVDVALRFDPRS